MSNITEMVRTEVMGRSLKYTEEVDDYDFWNEHIKLVVHYALEFAKKYHADLEIVELGALLHDIALVSNVGLRSEHHIQGATIALEILNKYGYDNCKTERVIKCVINHRSSKNAESNEELCVADADILSHFANIPMIFQVGFVLQKKNLRQVKAELKASLQNDFDDLSERAKKDFQKEYDTILSVLIKDI